MEFRKVTAIIRRERLPDVETRLIELGIAGITVTAVKGFGEYANYFRGDFLVAHVRLEIFTTPVGRPRGSIRTGRAKRNIPSASDFSQRARTSTPMSPLAISYHSASTRAASVIPVASVAAAGGPGRKPW